MWKSIQKSAAKMKTIDAGLCMSMGGIFIFAKLKTYQLVINQWNISKAKWKETKRNKQTNKQNKTKQKQKNKTCITGGIDVSDKL